MPSLNGLRRAGSRLFGGSRQEPDEHQPADGNSSGGPSAIDGYDRLGAKDIAGQLHRLSQSELEEVEDYERAHKNRTTVLNKLSYVRGSEPVPGYDALEAGAVVEILEQADGETVKAIRDYERKFRRRREVTEAVTRLLPEALPSERETLAKEEKLGRLRAGYESRAAANKEVAAGKPDPAAEHQS